MGTLVSLSKEATSAWLSRSEWALLICALLVVVGLIGEHKRAWPHPRYEFFLMLVVIGCAGEVFADGGIFVFSRHLQTIADTELKEVTEAAGKAQTSANLAADAATRAKGEADIAKQRADDVGKQAGTLATNLATDERREVALRQDVLKIFAKVGDRHLTPDQQRVVGSSLGLPGKKLSFIVLSKEEEVSTIAHDIFNAVSAAGNKDSAQWDCSFFTAPANVEPMRGIVVEILAPRSGKSDRIAASRLVTALRAYLDVDGPVPMKEFPDVFPYSTDKFMVGNERGEGTIDPDAHIRIIIGKK